MEHPYGGILLSRYSDNTIPAVQTMHATVWVNPTVVTLSEKSQTKSTRCMNRVWEFLAQAKLPYGNSNPKVVVRGGPEGTMWGDGTCLLSCFEGWVYGRIQLSEH